jgi:hypothetical protein
VDIKKTKRAGARVDTIGKTHALRDEAIEEVLRVRPSRSPLILGMEPPSTPTPSTQDCKDSFHKLSSKN